MSALPSRLRHLHSCPDSSTKAKSLPREEVRQAFQRFRTAAGRRSAAVRTDAPWEEKASEFEAMREEVHCFDNRNIPAVAAHEMNIVAAQSCV
jgi:hypothetical protein